MAILVHRPLVNQCLYLVLHERSAAIHFVVCRLLYHFRLRSSRLLFSSFLARKSKLVFRSARRLFDGVRDQRDCRSLGNNIDFWNRAPGWAKRHSSS